jgi:23S rRNA pseudouridine955/2504/2580 synthase
LQYSNQIQVPQFCYYRAMPERPVGSGVKYLEVLAGVGGQRIDNFLARELKGVPKPLIYRVIRRGEVRVNGGRVNAAFRLSDGDRVRVPPIRVSAAPAQTRPPPAMVRSLREAVLMETPELLIVNKPAGMAVHGGSKINWGVIEVLRSLGSKDDRLDLAHRLDRETSGCLVIAKSMQALREFQQLLRAGAVEKRYLTLLQGKWTYGERKIDVPVTRVRNAVLGEGERAPRSKRASSLFRPISVFENASLLEVRIETGRTHQIRLHAAHLGHSVAGDHRYGQPGFNKELARLGLQRMFLHASSIDFVLGGRQVSASAPLDASLAHMLTRLEAGSWA